MNNVYPVTSSRRKGAERGRGLPSPYDTCTRILNTLTSKVAILMYVAIFCVLGSAVAQINQKTIDAKLHGRALKTSSTTVGTIGGSTNATTGVLCFSQTFNYTDNFTQPAGYGGTIFKWVVPNGVTSIDVEVRGAAGNQGTSGGTSLFGPGAGSVQRATFNVTPCQTLWLLPGGTPTGLNLADGGGGSFVTTGVGVVTSTALVVAGGGGGSGNVANPNSNGQLSPTPGTAGSGGNAPQDGFGGTGGNGGHAATNPSSNSASGGGGFLGNGDPGTGAFGGDAGYGFPAYASNTNTNNSGGFGGGGSGGTTSNTTGGGGGGYSGGAGADMNNGIGGVGGGGGSFIASSATSVVTNNNTTLANTGNGVIIIRYCYTCPTNLNRPSVNTSTNTNSTSNGTQSFCQNFTPGASYQLTAQFPTGQDYANAGNGQCSNTNSNNNQAFEYSFQWFQDGVAIAGATTRTVTLPLATAGTHTYTVFVDCSGGSGPISPSVTVTVNPTPTASFAGGVGGTSSKTICTGGTVTYTINVCNTTGGPFSVVIHNGTTNTDQTVTGTGSSAVFTPSPAPTQNTTYTITLVTDNTTACSGTASTTCNGGSTTATATVNNGPQLSNVNTPAPQCAGQTIILSTGSTTPGLVYRWYKNSVPINDGTTGSGASNSGAGTATLTITNAQLPESGLYYVTATDPAALALGSGCATGTSNVVNVVINPLPTATFTPSGPTTICNGTNACQTVNFTGTPPFILVYTRSYDPGGGVTTSVTNTVSTTGTATSTCLTIPTGVSGTYMFTINSVQDANCVNTVNNPSTATDIVTAPFTLSRTPTGINCASGTGTVTVTPSGGINTITYTLSGPTSRPSQQGCFNCPVTFTGLSAGVYTITAVNGNSAACVATTTFTIGAAPSPIVVSAHTTNALPCSGGTTTVVANASGGTGPYTYSLDGGVPQPVPPAANVNPSTNTQGGTYTFTNVPVGPGNHTITVTDANGCSNSFVLVVLNPSPVVASGTPGVNTLACKGATTNITASASGGAVSTTYTYVLTGGPGAPQNSGPGRGNAFVFNNVFAGTYQVTAMDVNGCTGTSTTIVISEPPTALAGAITSTSATCNSGNNGTVVATAFGGTASPTTPNNSTGTQYAFTLAGPSTGTVTYLTNPPGGGISTATFSNLQPGVYTVTVRDANGCVLVLPNVTVGAPPAITANVTSTPIACNGGSSTVGMNSVAGGNGTPPITYTLTGTTASGTPFTTTFSSSASNPVFPAPVPAGTYSITANNSGCPTQPIGSNLTSPSSLGTLVIGQPNALVVTTAFTALSCNTSTSTVTLTATGGTATRTFRLINAATSVEVPGSPVVNNPGGSAGPTTATFTNIPAGTYNWLVTDNNGCSIQSSTNPNTQVIINAPSNVTISNVTTVSNTCANGQTGSFTVNASGGTGTLTYVAQMPGGGVVTMTSANPGSVTYSNLAAGNYTVTVTDIAGCGGTSTTTVVTQPTAVTPPGNTTGVPDLLMTDNISASSFTTGASCVSITYTITTKNTGGANLAAPGVIVRITKPFNGYTIALMNASTTMWTQTANNASFNEYTLNSGFQVPCSGSITLQVNVCRNGALQTSPGAPITGSVRLPGSGQDLNDFDNARAHQYSLQ